MRHDIIKGKVESILSECIGDDAFLEDENHENLDLHEEYHLELYEFAEIVVALNQAFGIDIVPTEVEWEDMDTVAKVTGLVEERLSRAGHATGGVADALAGRQGHGHMGA